MRYERLEKRIAVGVCALVGVVALSSCAGDETPAPRNEGTTTAAQVDTLGHVVQVAPGESAYTSVVLPESPAVTAVLEDLEVVDHQYQHGWSDENAPTITSRPQRIKGHVSLSGSHSNYIDDDVACDVVNLDFNGVDRSGARISAIAISEDSDDIVLVNWPTTPTGQTSDSATICFAEDYEPSDEVIVYMSTAEQLGT